MGRETEDSWIKRMSQDGAIAPADNLLGVQKALNGKLKKKKPSKVEAALQWYAGIIDKGISNLHAPKVPTWMKHIFDNKNAGTEVADYLRNR